MEQERHESIGGIVLITLAGLSLLLVIVNSILVLRNQSFQGEVTQRQQNIDQGQQVARLRQALLQVLANVAVAKNDHDISDLLAKHGISVAPPATSAAPAAPQGK
jgi:hypothetical protein